MFGLHENIRQGWKGHDINKHLTNGNHYGCKKLYSTGHWSHMLCPQQHASTFGSISHWHAKYLILCCFLLAAAKKFIRAGPYSLIFCLWVLITGVNLIQFFHPQRQRQFLSLDIFSEISFQYHLSSFKPNFNNLNLIH